MAEENDKIQFLGAAEKEASRVVDEMRLGGLNVSEVARRGLQTMLRETLSEEERMELHQRYVRGDLSEEVATVLLGDALGMIDRERAAFEAAMDRDTTGVYQE